MSMQSIAEAWNQVAEAQSGLPKLDVCRLRIAPAQCFEQPGPAWDAVAALTLREGWLQFQSVVTCFVDGQVPTPEKHWGCLLAAEAATTNNGSILVRQDGAGGIMLVTLTPGAGEGADEYVADEVSQLATGKVAQALGLKDPGPAAAKLRYRRYWNQDAASGFRPVLAAFIGFSRSA
jgi:hypothetical protein